jgi:hypothetical protein
VTPDLLVLGALIVGIALLLGALVAVTLAVAWLNSPRQPESDRSRGTLAPDHYARKG